MLNLRNWGSFFLVLFFIVLSSFTLASCTNEQKINKPPIMVPVKLSQTGVIADFIFEIKEHLVYEYYLKFNFPENDQNERSRVRKLLGGHEIDKFGKVIEPGIPTPLRLVITKIDPSSETTFYAIEIDPILTSWSGNSFGKNIGHCDLPPGKYRLHLENLRSSPEFSTIPITFGIGMDKFKFTFDPKKSDRSKSCPQ